MIIRAIKPLYILLFSFGLMATSASGQVNWTDIQVALNPAHQPKKKIMIDLYTGWCTWCKQMDQKTFNNRDIAQFINDNFTAVKFDAQRKETITYRGQEFSFVEYGRKGYNQLAAELCKTLDRLSFPTVVFLDEELNVIQPIPGYQDPKSMEVILHYMAGEHYKTTPFRSFKAKFTSQIN